MSILSACHNQWISRDSVIPANQPTPLPTPVTDYRSRTCRFSNHCSSHDQAYPAASQTYEEKYMESYNQVYSVNHAFVGGQKEVFSQDLRTPPLYIKFKITPEIEVGEKVDEAR